MLAYSIFVFSIGKMFGFYPGTEFFIAILIVFFYFLFAVWILRLSLNKEDKEFFKIYFGGVGIRVLITIFAILFFHKLEFSVLKIVLMMIPLYFIFTILEAMELNKLTEKTE